MKLTEVEPFFVPLGDEVLMDAPSTLKFTDQICVNAGGQSQTVQGHVWLTQDLLAFRPRLGMPHPQMVTLNRNLIAEAGCVHPRLLGFKAGAARLEVSYVPFGTPIPHLFTLDAPERWVEALGRSRRIQALGARELLQAALRDGSKSDVCAWRSTHRSELAGPASMSTPKIFPDGPPASNHCGCGCQKQKPRSSAG